MKLLYRMKHPLVLFLITFSAYFVLWLVVYKTGVNRLAIQSEDTLPAMFIPVAIIKEGSINLSSFYGMMIKRYPHPDDKKQALGLVPFYLKKVNGNYLTAFTLTPGILAVPVYLLPFFLGYEASWENLIILSRITSFFIVFLAGWVMYKLALLLTSDNKALLVSLIFLFATINFASISQALWQHGPLQLFSILGLYFFIRGLKDRNLLAYSGVFFGLAVITRPTAALPYLIFLVLVFGLRGVEGSLRFFLPSLVPFSFFYLYNRAYYVDISNQGYYSQLWDSWKTPWYLGVLGLLFSPSKGLLVYSPVFVVSIYNVVKQWAKRASGEIDLIYRYSGLVIVFHVVIVGMWKHWYGGWSFGYRMLSDIIPYLCLLLVPYLNLDLFKKTKNVFFFLVIWSVAFQLMGMVFFDGIWHAAYDKGFKDQSWLWSVSNSEVVFNVKRVLVKVGIIKPFI